VRVCKLIDDYAGMCIGCGRLSDEIKEWFYCDDNRKLEILEKSGKRVSNRMRGMRISNDCTG
jgi:predicted Fe-S protein YdhL (DUF1289 family)